MPADAHSILPVFSPRDSVLFPQLAVSFSIGRAQSLEAVHAALKNGQGLIAVFAQRNIVTQKIQDASELFPIGTRGLIESVRKTASGVQVQIVGIDRVSLERTPSAEPFLSGELQRLGAPRNDLDDLSRQFVEPLLGLAHRLMESGNTGFTLNPEAISSLIDEPLAIGYAIASLFDFSVQEQQRILAAPTISETLNAIVKSGEYELRELQLLKKRGGMDAAS